MCSTPAATPMSIMPAWIEVAMSVTDWSDDAHCRFTALNPDTSGNLGACQHVSATALRARRGPTCLPRLPSVERSQAAALGASELHQDRADVDVLDRAALDVDAHGLEALAGRLKHVRAMVVDRRGQRVRAGAEGEGEWRWEPGWTYRSSSGYMSCTRRGRTRRRHTTSAISQAGVLLDGCVP